MMEVSQSEYEECVDALLELEDGLSEWELKFVESVKAHDAYTDKQKAKIIEIYDRHC